MNRSPSPAARKLAQIALENAQSLLSNAARTLDSTPDAEPWSRERLNYAHAQDLVKHAQQQVNHLSGR